VRSLFGMERRSLGDSELWITPVGIGTAPIGSGRELLHRPGVSGAILGIRNEREAAQLPGAASVRLDRAELTEIESAAP
jgi:aryl-alcohol dehydrogenase-like predicted oxidoreductase